MTTCPGIVGRSCTCSQGYVGNGVGVTGCVAASGGGGGGGGGVGPCAGNPCAPYGICQVRRSYMLVRRRG